ncbi:hypothetical protein IX39_12850 [Chryseobacterium formosense]|uniref:Uncharacterized protein n=1 Tax=Chryseobacterium formosense TaxID=236814 RepID=A0A085Z1L6_9FLAO|nr:hypothetical protein [Chryseobacterium formosense]KFE98329.1 hypothetical protein IX39_12850 [Chryseobacterium formosense]SFT86454.1 hypothetical protein SAMN05421857_3766 [Chryseobacterium formosense]
MKALKITLTILFFLVFGIVMLFIFTNDFERKIKILDCEGVYYSKVLKKPDFYYLNNAVVDVGNCLCEKYMTKKDTVYEKEILKLFLTHRPIMTPDHIANAKVIKVDSICKYRSDIFIKMYDM